MKTITHCELCWIEAHRIEEKTIHIEDRYLCVPHCRAEGLDPADGVAVIQEVKRTERAPLLRGDHGKAAQHRCQREREEPTKREEFRLNLPTPKQRMAKKARAPRAKVEKARLPERECAADDCTERFTPSRKGHLFHSSTCENRQWYKNHPEAPKDPPAPRICAYHKCGVEFVPTQPNQQCCCNKHTKRRNDYIRSRRLGIPERRQNMTTWRWWRGLSHAERERVMQNELQAGMPPRLSTDGDRATVQ